MTEPNDVSDALSCFRWILLLGILAILTVGVFKGVTMLERCVVNLENLEMDLRKIADRSQPLPSP